MKYPIKELTSLNEEEPSLKTSEENISKKQSYEENLTEFKNSKENLTRMENSKENLEYSESEVNLPIKSESLSSWRKSTPENASKAFEVILRECGDYNRYQWQLTLICGLCGFFTALHNMGAVYLAATPEFSCNVPYLHGQNITEENPLYNASFPWVIGKKGNLELSKCEYYDIDLTSINETNFYDSNSSFYSNIEKKKCQSWTYKDDIFKSTVVTEFLAQYPINLEEDFLPSFVVAYLYQPQY
ncbi:Organic cation transporter-like protein [Armadillidium nasatum]|uniref:Organic cation transporter-like protein n=1 Tax=Armadillidium nasatum TaxID=96803 RepID=A0A5N5T7T7_9CRUS|nr:Organic cation transporter-like protein [Armadillidium nasatum]